MGWLDYVKEKGLSSLHIFLVLLQLVGLNYAEVDLELPGHMKPLGSHMDPLPVHRINYLPSPREFHNEYVSPKHPLIVEGALNNASVWRNWQDDDYLRKNFGNEIVGVEQGKKENRSDPRFMLSIKEFLDRYKEDDIYMVYNLPPPMYQEWEVPRPLLCGGFLDSINNMVFIWFSSGGTNSVLHSDSNDNFHCLVSGKKKLILIDPRYSRLIGPEHEEKGFYNIDVEKVDMTIYPELSWIPWYLAELKEGDCLYIPFMWIHNVHSFGRNMGVNIWWRQFQFNGDDCPPDKELPDFLPLNQVQLFPAMFIKDLLHGAARPDHSVYAEDLQKMIGESTVGVEVEMEFIKKLLNVLQPGCNGIVTNYEQIPQQRLKEGDVIIRNLLPPLPEEQEQPLPMEKDQEPPLPKEQDQEQPLLKEQDQEPPLPEEQDQEQPLPKEQDQEQPLPKEQDQEPPMPEEQDQEPPMPDEQDQEQPLPKEQDQEPPMPEEQDQEPPMPEEQDQEPPMPDEQDQEDKEFGRKGEEFLGNHATGGKEGSSDYGHNEL